MLEKIKNFFKSRVTQAVAWVVLVLCVIVLVVGGVTAETISSSVTLIVGVIVAISALITFIASQLK